MSKILNESKNICSELLILTYGSFVNQLIKDISNMEEVNKELYNAGYNIGVRLIEDFLSKNPVTNCLDFQDTADIVSKNAFKSYLGIIPTVTDWNLNKTEFSIVFEMNPLAESVELLPSMEKLWYSNVMAGIIKGALEMVLLDVETFFVKDQLRGDSYNEIRVKLLKKNTSTLPISE
ncbi:hypothetical protein HZS_2679 [Henneguya salminicola]|uniref:Trafficking protein particle complex subunit n=1 Tax=Henneguya salminicola TaxID=69463 RepID=A0A6G3MGC6_HENSL|nr:hypothetical protein HZS_2679 [Henneguya salminicola]